MREKVLSMLGLMRKASAVALGEDHSAEAIGKGRAKLLLLAEDASEKQVQRAERLTEGHNVQIVRLPFGSAEAAAAVGIGNCNMMTVTDLGFANALMKLLQQLDDDRYGAAAGEVQKRLAKVERRKIEKPGAKAKKKTAGGK